MAFAGAEAGASASARPRWRRWLLEAYRELAAKLEAYPLERIGLAMVAAGVVLRLAAPFLMDFRADGNTYTAMGHAWAIGHDFLMPYGEVSTTNPTPPMHSHHYPPAYPFYLGLVFTVFGFGLWQAKIAAVVVALAALGVVYATTRDLYGRVPAALTAGLLAVEPHLVWTTGTGFSENMVLMFFALTMWAILKSLQDDRFIVYAGIFAGLTYLSRASVGYFFVIAGIGGLLWRLTFRGWGVLTNKWYLGAIASFLGIGGAWALRNVMRFGYESRSFSVGEILPFAVPGLLVLAVVLALPFLANPRLRRLPNFLPSFGLGALSGILALVLVMKSAGATFDVLSWRFHPPRWYTSSYVDFVQTYAWERKGEWGAALQRKIPYFILFLLWWAAPLLPESWRAIKRAREESASALFLSVFLVWVIAWIISGMFTVFERVDFISNNHRYVIIGLLPLAWLLVREARLERASTRLRVILLGLSLFAASGAVFFDPVKYSDLRAAEFMDPYLRPGDDVGIGYGGSIKYAFYPYLSDPRSIRVYFCGDVWENGAPVPASDPCIVGAPAANLSAEFILTLGREEPLGYARVGTFQQRFADGGVMPTWLWARDDVVRERGIPTGIEREW